MQFAKLILLFVMLVACEATNKDDRIANATKTFLDNLKREDGFLQNLTFEKG